MHNYLPINYKKILYMDGDMLATGDITMLLEKSVPVGRFAAVEDMLSFRARRQLLFNNGIKDHMKELGIRSNYSYFNAGMFFVQRETWNIISTEAFEFFVQNTKKCT